MIGQAVYEKMFEKCECRTPDHGYTLSSPSEPSAQELKRK